jgi:hypothetical protein
MDVFSMIGINDQGGYNISSIMGNNKALKTLVGGGANHSNLSIPYGLYTSSFKPTRKLNMNKRDSDSDSDSDDDQLYNNDDDELDLFDEKDDVSKVVDDDLYDNLLALMDVENESNIKDTSTPSASTIQMIVAEIDDKPPITSKKNKTRKNKSIIKTSIWKTKLTKQNKHKPSHKNKNTTRSKRRN